MGLPHSCQIAFTEDEGLSLDCDQIEVKPFRISNLFGVRCPAALW